MNKRDEYIIREENETIKNPQKVGMRYIYGPPPRRGDRLFGKMGIEPDLLDSSDKDITDMSDISGFGG